MTNDHREQAREIELSPCPFCGSASVVWSEHFRRVRCNGCFIGTAPLGEFNYAPDVLAKLTTSSIEAWNARADILASRDTEIKQVLEGLRFRHGCWCELPPNVGSPDHTDACLAAGTLWEKVKPKESSDATE